MKGEIVSHRVSQQQGRKVLNPLVIRVVCSEVEMEKEIGGWECLRPAMSGTERSCLKAQMYEDLLL
jgi:hypothetical protein